MAVVLDKIKWLYHEFGLSSVVRAGSDAWIIILQRTLRMFAYGTTSLILALFFASLGFTDYQIGLFMTMTLAGDVVLGTLLTLVADKIGRRKILLAGALLMILTGAFFAFFENFWILLIAAVVGVVSATGGDFGPFRSIEESIISELTTPNTRSDVLSWYVTISAIGSAVGSEIAGRLVHWLLNRDGWKTKDAYHAMFWMYTLMGFANFVLMLCLSKKCELQTSKLETDVIASDETEGMLASDSGSDTLHDEEEQGSTTSNTKAASTVASKKNSWLTAISSKTRRTMYALWFLLMLDSLADGMVPYSLTNYYMDEKFHLAKSTLGDIQSVSYILAAIGTFFAAPLARRLGLVNTMVWTHVPSSTAVLLFPFPNIVWMTVGLFFIRAGLNNMDQAPRSAFIAAVVKPEERTAVMGITAMVRTLAATAGPSITGVLAGSNNFWIAFVAAGICRLAYDFGLWAMFRRVPLNEHEKQEEHVPAASVSSDDGERGDSVELGKL